MQKHKNKMKKRKAIRACTRKEINYFVSCKRSLSPVIATVLLVAMVIVIGAIVFLWMRGSVKEVIYKFGEENIELACGDVSFDVEYYTNISGDTLYVVNNGNVPIYAVDVKMSEGGSSEIIHARAAEKGQVDIDAAAAAWMLRYLLEKSERLIWPGPSSSVSAGIQTMALRAAE